MYAKHIKFAPQGQQLQYFGKEPDSVRSTNPDILLAKLRPGQEIRVTLHCHKSNGADHAKYSPVATASYRLMPEIRILNPIMGDDARKFARCFPRGVVELRRVGDEDAMQPGGPYEGKKGEVYAAVNDAMKDTVSRECLRHAEFKDKVQLGGCATTSSSGSSRRGRLRARDPRAGGQDAGGQVHDGAVADRADGQEEPVTSNDCINGQRLGVYALCELQRLLFTLTSRGIGRCSTQRQDMLTRGLRLEF